MRKRLRICPLLPSVVRTYRPRRAGATQTVRHCVYVRCVAGTQPTAAAQCTGRGAVGVGASPHSVSPHVLRRHYRRNGRPMHASCFTPRNYNTCCSCLYAASGGSGSPSAGSAITSATKPAITAATHSPSSSGHRRRRVVDDETQMRLALRGHVLTLPICRPAYVVCLPIAAALPARACPARTYATTLYWRRGVPGAMRVSSCGPARASRY
jgi:hypothetical protein